MQPAERNFAEDVEDAQAVEEQLQRLISSSYFSHSQRLSSFLSFIVQQTLAGHSDLLKERTLGIEVFRRGLEYDTASDSIVRVTAAELRKRIALYYVEPGRQHELRILLQPGSYVPHFQWPDSVHPGAAPAPEVVPAPSQPDSPRLPGQRFRRAAIPALIGVALIAAIFIVAGVLHRKPHPDPSQIEAFWAPVLNSSDPVLFCMADQSRYPDITLTDAANLNRRVTLHSSLTTVDIDDLGPLVTIGGVLQQHGRTFTIKAEDATNLMDLRNGPTVFIGAFDNAWTLRLTRNLRYRFVNNADMSEFGIADSAVSSTMKWKVDRQQQIATNVYRDYAIVARFTAPVTGHLAIVAAGVGLGGTIAAGQFLTSPTDMAEVMHKAGGRTNMEIVIGTQIIDGEPGNPKMVAAYYW